jgi:hypothetical protein
MNDARRDGRRVPISDEDDDARPGEAPDIKEPLAERSRLGRARG